MLIILCCHIPSFNQQRKKQESCDCNSNHRDSLIFRHTFYKMTAYLLLNLTSCGFSVCTINCNSLAEVCVKLLLWSYTSRLKKEIHIIISMIGSGVQVWSVWGPPSSSRHAYSQSCDWSDLRFDSNCRGSRISFQVPSQTALFTSLSLNARTPPHPLSFPWASFL